MSGRLAGRRPLVRVVKVGGSLLDWRPLRAALPRWLEEQPTAANVLVAGGGALADAIRRADATHGLGEERSHALCIDVLGVTARLLAALMAGRAELASWRKLQERRASGRLPPCAVLDVPTFVAATEAADPRGGLPHTWSVTSDSITAWIGCALAADELVLLKSGDVAAACGRQPSAHELALAGYVDRCFPAAVARFAGVWRTVNLRRAPSRRQEQATK